MQNQRDIDLSTEVARRHQAWYGISEREFLAWKAHRDNSAARGIAFRFTLLGWTLWWRHELALRGPKATRGRNRGNYVMARIRDRGAYEAGNVRCLNVKQNANDRPHVDREIAMIRVKAAREASGNPLGKHLWVRGDGHPRSKAIITPAGRFGSMALAADHHGITRQAVHCRIKGGSPGWHVE